MIQALVLSPFCVVQEGCAVAWQFGSTHRKSQAAEMHRHQAALVGSPGPRVTMRCPSLLPNAAGLCEQGDCLGMRRKQGCNAERVLKPVFRVCLLSLCSGTSNESARGSPQHLQPLRARPARVWWATSARHSSPANLCLAFPPGEHPGAGFSVLMLHKYLQGDPKQGLSVQGGLILTVPLPAPSLCISLAGAAGFYFFF